MSKKQESKGAKGTKNNKNMKKPPSIKINYRGMASNYITTLNDSCRSKSLKKYLNPTKVTKKNKSSSLIKRFAIELSKGKSKKSDSKSRTFFQPEYTGKIDTNFLVQSLLNDNPSVSPKSTKAGKTYNVSTTFIKFRVK